MIYFDSSQTAPERIFLFQHYPCRGAQLWELQSYKAKLSAWFLYQFLLGFALFCFSAGEKFPLQISPEHLELQALHTCS